MNKNEKKTDTEFEFDVILSKANGSYAGMLKCLYSIKFIVKKELTKEQEACAFNCLNVLSEDTKAPPEVRAFCYTELGNILAGSSNFIKISK
jgi:hypothetical protein